MQNFDVHAYGKTCSTLLSEMPPCELGPGSPDRRIADRLRELDPATLFDGRSIVDREMASCCLAGIWLAFNFLDESHRISQGIETPSGAYWHGIMHRREPDFSNAKYWFRRVGRHPIFGDLAAAAASSFEAGSDEPGRGSGRAGGAEWDAFDFVDRCERAIRKGTDAEECRRLAEAEWQLLFDYCHRQAVGDDGPPPGPGT